MALRLVFLITDLDLGGSPLMLRGLARGLKEMGVEVVVVSVGPAGVVGGMMRADGVEVRSLEAGGVGDLWEVVGRWVKLLEEVRPDGVMSVLVHANVVAGLGRMVMRGRGEREVPWATSIHTLQRKPAWHWWAQGLVGSWADGVVVPAGEILRRMEGYGAFGRGVVIENGIDLERFARVAPMDPTSLPFDPRRAIVGYVGRFDVVKRLDTLIAAVGRIKICNPLLYEGLQLVLVGYGAEEESLKAEVLKWGILGHVTFTGPSTEVERWYKSFSCYCLPSDAEGFGLTLVEAMAAGVPVVAARTAISERILKGKGWFYPAGDAMSLAVVLQDVIAKKRANLELGRVEEGALDEYSQGRMVERYFAFFQKFLKL